MMPALIACTSSPMPGTSTTTITCATGRNLHFVLTHADRLDDHVIAARGVHQVRQVRRSAGQPAHGAPRGHRTDENAGVGVVLLHADPVAQDRAAGKFGMLGSTARMASDLALPAQFQREARLPACSCRRREVR